MKFAAMAAAAAAALLSISALAQGTASKQRFQCWHDKNGQKMCGDRVPPEYAGQQRDVLQGGRVVETVKAAKTPEEIAEEKRQKKLAEEAQRQADYDRQLLTTYRTAKDIQTMRDERIALIDTRLDAAQKNSADTDRGLQGLRARAEAAAKEGKPVDEKLAKQIKQFEKAQKTNQKAIERYNAEREEVLTTFNRDLERYNALKGVPSPAKSASADKPAAADKSPATPAPAPAANKPAPSGAPAPAPAPKS